jgi:hypothetical protein
MFALPWLNARGEKPPAESVESSAGEWFGSVTGHRTAGLAGWAPRSEAAIATKTADAGTAERLATRTNEVQRTGLEGSSGCATLQVVARRKKPRSLLEVNTLLAAATFLPEDVRASPRRLSLMEQARTLAKALPKATRVGEFISMWAITKNRDGVATVETVAEMWGEAERTMYRRLEEFREVWEPAGYDTPDPIADVLIADYRTRQQSLSATQLPRLLGIPVPVPSGAAGWAE